MVEALLRLSPALLSATDHNGTTPLHSAAVMGKADECKLLLKHGVDICAKDSNGWIPLLYALLRFVKFARYLDMGLKSAPSSDEVETSLELLNISRAQTVDQLRCLGTIVHLADREADCYFHSYFHQRCCLMTERFTFSKSHNFEQCWRSLLLSPNFRQLSTRFCSKNTDSSR